MRLTEKVRKAINDQINAEMWSSNLYLSMSMFLKHEGYDGFSAWMMMQSQEELGHAYEMADFVNKRGGKVEITKVDAVPTTFDGPLDIFEKAYEHECKVTELIEGVVKVASEERDMATQDFFWKFVREQVEEEDSASQIVSDIKLAGDLHISLIDHSIMERRRSDKK
ncbi:ferritin [Falsiporphyromonas endometrii]|uniref:Ferritin n=1 Tax=Falsiporphyromonas endometrii TaxID=1387297 RepID=A0ABV9K9C7_9PORP|nr:ferritin [Porphyromonadaceae bacterium]